MNAPVSARPPRGRAGSGGRLGRFRTDLWPLAVVVLLVGGTALWGTVLGGRVELAAPPFVGHWEIRLPPQTLVVLGVAALGWRVAPAAQRLPWTWLLLAMWGLGLLWAVSLAAIDGQAGFTRPLLMRDDYLHDVPRVHSGFLATFTDHIVGGPDPWTTHVAGHPPGLVLLLKGLEIVGLGGPWPAAVLFVGAGTSAVVAVLVTVRRVVDEPTARACAPFLALAPAMVWVATSGDALFLGVTAWGIALLALSRPFAGGVVLGCSLLLTYGALPLGLLALVVLRRPLAVAWGAAGVLAPLGVFAAFGFWWPEGLHQTLIRYHAGAGGSRPWEYFLLSNVAVLAVAVGPATVMALRRVVRGDRLWLLLAPVLLGLLAVQLTGTSRGEVERIWLPFMPWLLVATARLGHSRRWLAVQLVIGLAMQVLLRSKW